MKNAYQKKYDNVSLIGEETPTGSWADWDNLSGTDVQEFIKDKLEDAIVDFEYAGTTLNGYNAFGQLVASTPVIVTDPTFRFEEGSLEINEFRINGDLINMSKYTGNANSNLTASLNFTYNLIQEIGGEAKQHSTTAVTYEITLVEENGNPIPQISPITGKCNWSPNGINVNSESLKNLLLLRTNKTSKLQIRLSIDYTVTVGESKTVETAEVITEASEMTILNLRRLSLTYSGSSLIKSNSITLGGDKVEGTGIEDVNNYEIQYALNGEYVEILDSIDNAASPKIPLTRVINADTKVQPITLCARIVSKDGMLSSDWLSLNLLYQKADWIENTGATAIISNIPTEITNCDAPALFQIMTTDKLSGNVKIYAYKSNNLGAIQNISTDPNSMYYYKNDTFAEYLFKQVTLSLNTAEDHDPDLKYYSYVELDPDSLGSSSIIYLTFIIEPEVGEAQRQVFYYGSEGTVMAQNYNAIKIVTNKYGRELLYTSGPIIDYSLISTTNTFNQDGKQVLLFDESNLSGKIDSADGLVQDGKYVGFKVSPLGKTGDVVENLFKKPIHLMDTDGNDLLSTDNFSIEFNLKTYNVNDDNDLIAKIGNIYIYPHYLRVYESSEGISASTGRRDLASVYEASCANFSKDEITNIVITYDANYKADTYNVLYDDLYHGDSSKFTTDAPTYPCLKVYINGTVNRSVSVNKAKLGESYFNIHPSSANINIYGFRTYARTLSYEEILKNRISSMNSFEEKEAYYINNDILFKQDDFSSSDWSKVSDKANTICFEKVLGTFKGVRDRKYNPKNVILIVTDDRGPMMFANSNGKDPVTGLKLKYKDAAMFIKYADNAKKVLKDANGTIIGGDGKLIGQRLVSHFAYDEYYKSQGSSAKRYGGAYNVQMAKFWYIPDSYINEVSENLKYIEKTASELVLKDDVYKPAAASEEGYTYKVYSKTHPEGEDKVSKTADNKDTKTLWKNVIDKAVSKSANKANLSEESELVGQDIAKDFGLADYDGSNVVRIAKSVGKVNYASSMQAHKPGGTDLFAECYPDRANDYCKRRAVHEDPFYYFFIKLSDCKDKADGSRPTFWTVTWDDIDPLKVSFFGFLTWGSAKMDKPTFGNGGDDDQEYLCIEGADNKNQCTNFKTPWAAQQMWRDDANQLNLPFYAEAQNKAPGEYVNQHSGKNPDGTPNYTDGILFYDETIMFRTTSLLEDAAGKDAINKNAESWDVAGNALTETENPAGGEFDTSFTWNSEAAKISFSRFAEWFNSIYVSDFGNLEILPSFGYAGTAANPILIDNDESASALDIQKKYIVPTDWYYRNINSRSKGVDYSDVSAISVGGGDVLRYDPIFNKWVNAGLYYDTRNGAWEKFNIIDLCNAIRRVVAGSSPASMQGGLFSLWVTYVQSIVDKALANSGKDKTKFFVRTGNDYPLIASTLNQYGLLNDVINKDNNLSRIKLSLSELFKAAIWAYCDVDSFAYHLAAIRFLSGTDNRAKNLYFLIKGRKYSGDTPLAEDDENQYKFKNRDLITLFLDDVDTIFATDNNGQQAKPYNLMEPAYNLETIGDWGDSRSGLWYNFDIIFGEEIKNHLQRIITWATGNGGQIIDKSNPLYTRFLKMQDTEFAQIAYNHTSEIYYDAMQSVFNNSLSETGSLTEFGQTIPGFANNNFNDNQVPNPESLVHGSCIESEKQFLKKRVALLASYSEAPYKTEYNGLDKIGVKGDTAGGTTSASEIAMSHLAYIQDYYPKFVNTSLQSFEKTGHDPVIDALSKLGPTNTVYSNPNTYVYNKIDEDNKTIDYSVSATLITDLTSAEEIQYTSYIKEVNFTKGMHQIVSMRLPNASVVTCEVPEDMSPKKGISFNGGQTETILYMDNIVPNVEILRAPYSIFNKDRVDFSNCTRLKELDLSYSTYNGMDPISLILLPKSSKLTKVVLPSTLKDITIEYYPGITSLEDFTFDDEQVSLDSINLNMKNSWAFAFLDKYAESSKKIILNNLPEEVTMSSALLQKLSELAIKGNFTFGNNSITINLEVGSRMTITLKSLLAEAFGDIDSSDASQKVKVNYLIFPAVSISTVDEEIQITKTGVTTNPFGAKLLASDGEEANNIKIKNGRLAFTYNIANNKSGVSLDSTTSGNVVVSEATNINNTDDINVTISAELLSGTVPNKVVVLKFGDYIPQLGDIAYADGTFGSKYNGKEAIGFVYWSNLIAENLTEGTRTFDVRVMSNDSYVEKFGPSAFGVGYNGNTYIKPSSYGSVIELLISDFKNDLVDLNSIAGENLRLDQKHYEGSSFPVDGILESGVKTNLSTTDSTITPSFDLQLLPTVSDKTTATKPKSNLYCNKYITEAIGTEVISKYNVLKQNAKFRSNLNGTNLNKEQFETIKSRLTVTDSNGITYPADWLIYPAFTKTYLYSPDTENSQLSEDYKEHNWYVPSSIELSWILQLKITMMYNPALSNPGDLWNAASDQFYSGTSLKTYNTKNIFYKLLSAYNATTYAAFLSNSKVKNIGILNVDPIKNISLYDSDKFIIKSGTFTNFHEGSTMSNRDFQSTIVYSKAVNGNPPKTGWNNSPSYSSGSSYVPNIAEGRVCPCCRVIKTVKI